ncbi:MAG: carbohydrate kinase [Verrucomicrobiota bacterium]
MKTPAIVSIGEVLWDLFPNETRFGGAPANFACHAATLGAEVTMISAVGNDPKGREAIEILAAYEIHTDLIQTPATAPTGTVGVNLDQNGKPTFTIHNDAAWDGLVWTPEIKPRVEQADAVYFGTLGQRSPLSRDTIRRTLEVAKSSQIPGILDVNLRTPFFDDALIQDSIRLTDILKLSDDELPVTCAACNVPMANDPRDSLLQLMQQYQLDLAVLTRGAKGALLVTRDEIIDQPGIPTSVVDTVGAGDAFTAAFVLGLLRGTPHADLLQHACELAAETCSQSGAVPVPIKSNS